MSNEEVIMNDDDELIEDDNEEEKDPIDRSIEVLDISKRTRSVLLNNGITTIKDLKMNISKISELNGISDKGADDIRKKLNQYMIDNDIVETVEHSDLYIRSDEDWKNYNQLESLKLEKIPGITTGIYETIRKKGYNSIANLKSITSFDEFVEIFGNVKGLSERRLAMIYSAISSYGLYSNVTGLDILRARRRMVKLMIKYFEKLSSLLGGLAFGDSYILWGLYESGKTSLALWIMLSAFLPIEQNGLVTKNHVPYVKFIDTEHTFKTLLEPKREIVDNKMVEKPSRFEKYCETLGLDPEFVLEHIIVREVNSSDDLMDAVDEIYFEIDERRYDLIIIDSLTKTFRAEDSDSKMNEKARSKSKHARIAQKLGVIAGYCPSIVIAINQAYHDVKSGYEVPSGGSNVLHNWNHSIHVRRIGAGMEHTAQIDASSNTAPGNKIKFAIYEDKLTEIT